MTHRSNLLLFLASALFILFVPTQPINAQPDEYSAPEKKWFTLETKHFTVNYHEGAERTARAVAKIAEDIYGPITSLYQHEPDEKVSFVIKDISDYSNGAAYFFNNKIEIWASPLDFELRGTHNWLRNVISHEFTHIIQIQSSMKWGRKLPAITLQWFGYERERRTDVLYGFPNLLVSYPIPGVIVPPWLAEGTAQYMRNEFGYEHWDSHRDMILRCYALSDSMLTWSQMSAFGKTSLGNESVYNAGYNLTRYIAKTYGEKAIADITRAMSKTFTFTIDRAIKDVLNISGRQLYDEWTAQVANEYQRRIAPVLQGRIEGNLIADIGFGNFYPTYSPDSSKLAYVSNKTSDYFGQSGIFLYDLESKEEYIVTTGVRSALSWSPDGKKIIFSKYNPPSTYGHLYYDLYYYDLSTREEERLTHDLRAHNPSYSPDGGTIAFVFTKDGSVNIGIVDSDGKNFRQVTNFTNGEQAFTPRWSPDGTHIVFGYSARAQRAIAKINPDGSDFQVLIGNPHYDCRDPKYSPDGSFIYYASDRTGIFNIYRYETGTGKIEQLTNVIGGAFMPAVDAKGNLAYAAYTSTGYKIALLPEAQPLRMSGSDYLPAQTFVPQIASTDFDAYDWDALRDYDDTKLPTINVKSYKNIFQSLMIFPTIRIDEYNPENKGLALLKPGVMLFSSDILNRLEMLASGAINLKGERDLYLNFTYRDRIPLLYDLGIFPSVNLQVFNVTRSTRSTIALPLDTLGVDVDFSLLEFAAGLQHNLFDNRTRLDLGYRHSRYTGTIGSFRNPDTDILIPARDNLYYIGNDLHVGFRHQEMNPARDSEINPTGVRFGFHYNYEFNRFNPTGDFTIEQGMLVPLYRHFNYNRLETNLLIALPLPAWRHALSFRVRAGSILGPPVDDFFNFYAGGIIGMQGYSFYALGGNELYSVNITYRFPIIANMDFRIGHMLFDKLYGGIFYDVGDAVSRESEFTLANRKEDVGFEIRMETFSFSMYPTRIFFSGAYGLTEFTRTFDLAPVKYGHEWRWYFGVLFGFDLSDV